MNMKHTIIFIMTILAITFIVLPTGRVFAATTPTPTGSVNNIEQQIDNLKDRIASRVAQLKLVDKRSVVGKVTSVSETQLTLMDTKGNVRIIDVDELTKFSSPTAKSSFGISDITKGTLIGTIGLYNKDSRHLLARWVDVLQSPTIYSGAILSIDKDNFNITVETPDKEDHVVNIQDITKTSSYSSATNLTKSGFSKLQEGQRVMVIGVPDAKNSSTLLATRILVFPSLPINPAITLVKPGDIAPITPSTGSGKKLTPIVK